MGFLSERYNYLKGLADGLELNKDSKEGKVIIAMLELLDDMVLTIEDLEDSRDEINEMLDEIDEDLANLEDAVYGEEDDSDSVDFGEAECPECGALINLDYSLFSEDGDKITCPSCNKEIDVEWDYYCDDECGCDESDVSDKSNDSEES